MVQQDLGAKRPRAIVVHPVFRPRHLQRPAKGGSGVCKTSSWRPPALSQDSQETVDGYPTKEMAGLAFQGQSASPHRKALALRPRIGIQ
jgi:hypothetical protein